MASAESQFKFDWVEYSVVAVMLLLSTLIGVYYAFIKKQKTFNDYMLGGKSMGVFPVSMSLVASFISGITLLGLPTEIYLYGTQYVISNIANITVMMITGIFYLPVYYKLQLNSIYEYLELRFNHNVRILGTLMYSLSVVLFLPVVIFVPALAFNQVTDVSVHLITPIISASCLFYTAFGGLKAVMWTDAVQNVFTLLAAVALVILGTIKVGGVKEVWRINEEGSRIELFNMDPDPFARNTFWSVSLGCLIMYLTTIATNPGSVQRFLAVPSLRHARMVLFWSSIGFYIIINLSNFMGLVIYARYHQCDPIASGQIKNPTQIVPLYVMEIGKNYPGLAGLFLSGVLSAALSTMSAWLNTVAGTLYKDVMEVFFPHKRHSEPKQSSIIKSLVVILGVVCIALVVVVEKLGTVWQMSNSLLGIVNGSVLSLFTLGIFFPRANVKGVVTGTIASLLLAGWIVINAQYYIMNGKLKFPGKITSIDECPANIIQHFNSSTDLLFNYTDVGTPVIVDDSVPQIFRVSFNYYVLIGSLTSIVVGVVVSLLTEPPDLTTMSPDLFSTYVHRFLPSKCLQTRPTKDEYVLTNSQDFENQKE